ncbi:MAG: PilC/PilY family type IV pilus protein [Amphritea sp.]|nr:PilC/PilY family type IV pilus protein [Amphritea sp.]
MYRYYLVLLVGLFSSSVMATAISQNPLYLVKSANPNVLFNMSIEEPMGGAAYNDQPGTLAGGSVCGGRRGGFGECYFSSETYLGYFDPKKCYRYNYSRGYFEPGGTANSDHSCSSGYSGNMMNWASMTAMDMFVYTLTGGNRVVDNTGKNAVTAIKRARYNGSYFPQKRLGSSYNVSTGSVTPYGGYSYVIINNYSASGFSSERIQFCPNGSCYPSMNLHVRVCDVDEGLEANCTSYSGGDYYKPEGLIQSRSGSMRFAVTSYLNHNDIHRHGGVLRANMKYVGRFLPDGSANSNAELAADGTFPNDPDNLTGGSGIDSSGVINYINKFSEYGYKRFDPASELFYESIRYFKNLGPTPEYSSGLTDAMKGGFPVLDSAGEWDDPIQYSCQKNFIIGINDANPWVDKRLPGTHFTAYNTNGGSHSWDDYREPSNPDREIDVKALTNKVGQLEGLNGTNQLIGCVPGNCDYRNTVKKISGLGEVSGTAPGAGKENSYYIAGLAYYANTQDIRTDGGMDGEQNVTTFMIDSQEYSNNPLIGQMNMLWLAGKYGGFVDSNGNDEPDLQSEWDADKNGEPDNYVLATRPDLMISSLKSSFDDIEAQTSSASAIAANSTRLDTDTKIYQAKYSSDGWSGDLLAYALDPVTGMPGSEESWKASDLMPAHSARSIFTHNGTAAVEFKHTNLSSVQQALITLDELNYIRGDNSQEGSPFRVRKHALGDIINSDPLYTGSERFNYFSLEMATGGATQVSTYARYLSGTDSTEKGHRPEVIYVGANDGMLHAFLAEDDPSLSSGSSCSASANDCAGEEIFAYIPKALVPSLRDLTTTAYRHRFYVDGSSRHGDAYIDFDSAGTPRWGTALVGTLGAGGKGIFALDISDPLNFTTADVLWDKDSSDTDFLDLGYTYSQPTIVKMANGVWTAVFGNGYNSTNHEAVLYIVNLETGSVIRKIHTGAFGSASATNGLSTPIVIDTDGDLLADRAYAGDLQGNLWAFDLSDKSSVSNWKVAYKSGSTPAPLFTAVDDNSKTQPITAKPQIVKAATGEFVVLFGSGQFFAVGDHSSTATQTFYGIYDNGKNAVSGRNSLTEQNIIYEGRSTGATAVNRVTTDNRLGNNDKGWFIDLGVVDTNGDGSPDKTTRPGERVIVDALVRSGRVIFPTLIASIDPCVPGGSSMIMELDSLTGSRLTSSPFDTNGDGVIDAKDLIDHDNDPSTPPVASSGLETDVGIVKKPGVISRGQDEKKYVTGSDGNIQVITETGGDSLGRQSWLQLK